jgi:hypothetical protein
MWMLLLPALKRRAKVSRHYSGEFMHTLHITMQQKTLLTKW